MASFSAPVTATPDSRLSLAERAARQVRTYWRVRISKTLERLEREARRMLQLEEELGAFAVQYYAAVGGPAERLATLEEQLAQEAALTKKTLPRAPSAAVPLKELPAVIAQCDARAARRRELKARYRHLAKEIHPDRAMVVTGQGSKASHMHTLNAAYQHGDLAALLKLEAEILLNQIAQEEGATSATTSQLDTALREVERAADTYADAYRGLLHSPINELMLRALNAKLAGWDWTEAVIRRLERTIEEKERAAVMANIAAIGEWREIAQTAA